MVPGAKKTMSASSIGTRDRLGSNLRESARIAEPIDFALQVANGHADKVFVGGIAASLMPERFAAEGRWRGIRFIKGLLTKPPADSLQLDDFSEELYSDDRDGTPIEDLIPDYPRIDIPATEYH
jgi:hypothetical protein